MKEECCRKCEFYEERTGFCRRFPPTPVVIAIQNKHTKQLKDHVVSKYPVISFPDADWCAEFILTINV